MKTNHTILRKSFALALTLFAAGTMQAQVLFDNGPLANSFGTGAGGADESMLYTTTFGMSTIGAGHQSNLFNRVADDFVNPNCLWVIDSIVFFGYQTGSSTTSTFTGVNFRVWDGVPDAVGSNVVYGDTTTNRMTRSVWSGVYRITETTHGNSTRPIMRNVCSTPGLTVQAGTFWIDWASTGSLASGPWAPPRVPLNQNITGNARQRIGSTWNNLLDGGTGTPAQGLPFIIYGHIVEPSADAGLTSTICAGATTILGGAPAGSGGNGTLTYAWSEGTTLSDSTLENPVATPMVTTNYVLTVTDSLGCVAIDSVLVTVLQPTTSMETPTVCDAYVSPGGNTYTTSGMYMDTLVNAAGCDSIITINLTVNNTAMATISPVTCVQFVSPSGMVLTASGTYMDTIPTVAGCDSIITINLTINNTASSTISPTACNSYTSPSGMVLTASGTYMDTVTSVNGCDSVITIQLTMLSSSTASVNATACGSYTAPSGAVFTSSGIYMDTIPNMAGCDSIITLDLTINAPSTSSMSISACDMYTAPSGAVFTASGTYTDIIPNSVGCDSAITIQLTINTVNTNVTVSSFVLTSAAAGATYQWVDCANNFTPIAGATGQSFTPTVDGSYAVIVTENSCTDTSACNTIIGIGIEELASGNVNVYPNPVNEVLTIDLGSEQKDIVVSVTDMNGRVVKTESVNAARFVNMNLDLAAGLYILTVQTENGVVTKELIKQ